MVPVLIVCMCSDLFQRRGHAQEAFAVPHLPTAQERPFLLPQGPRQPHQAGPREASLCIKGTGQPSRVRPAWFEQMSSPRRCKESLCWSVHLSLMPAFLAQVQTGKLHSWLVRNYPHAGCLFTHTKILCSVPRRCDPGEYTRWSIFSLATGGIYCLLSAPSLAESPAREGSVVLIKANGSSSVLWSQYFGFPSQWGS